MGHSLLVAPVAIALALAAGPLLPAQDAPEAPVAAGSEGVPVPRKTKHVQPAYPAEALGRGVRGIVILDIVVDARGKVESAGIVRSVPGLDEAAIAAARQWEYEPTRLGGKPVRVRITVPITFSLALPRLTRQEGIPDLRQGVTPAWPADSSGGGLAVAEVTLEPDGRVGVANVLEGEAPWSDSLLAALRTWRFAPPPEDQVLSFRVEAEFVPGRASQAGRVDLRAAGLQRSDLLGEAATPPEAPASPEAPAAPPPPAPASAGPDEPAPASTAPAGLAPSPPAEPPAAPQATPPAAPAAGETARVAPPEAPAPPASTPPAAASPAAEPALAPSSPPVPSEAASSPSAAALPPPVEVITVPPPAPRPESGISAIRDVTLEAGVPDLTRGRRPVASPLARMAGVTGTVEVTFSVSAAGATTVQGATGPELLRPAAEQAVATWQFRRERADRLYLVAVFTYVDDRATAVVRPQDGASSEVPATTGTPAP
jgi:TonB family protein